MSRRKLEQLKKRLSIDEKSIGKGHKYASILIDVEEKRVLDVCKGRDKKSVKQLINNTLQGNLVDKVEYVGSLYVSR